MTDYKLYRANETKYFVQIKAYTNFLINALKYTGNSNYKNFYKFYKYNKLF